MFLLVIMNYSWLEDKYKRANKVRTIAAIAFAILVVTSPNFTVDQISLYSALILYIQGFIVVKIFYCLLTIRFWIKNSGTVSFSQIGELTEAKLIVLPTILLLGTHWCLNSTAETVLTITLLLFNSLLLVMSFAIGDELYLLFKHSKTDKFYQLCFQIHQRQYIFTYKKGICDR